MTRQSSGRECREAGGARQAPGVDGGRAPAALVVQQPRERRYGVTLRVGAYAPDGPALRRRLAVQPGTGGRDHRARAVLLAASSITFTTAFGCDRKGT